jgi:hypothetical protein
MIASYWIVYSLILYFGIGQLFLVGKDATSYLVKGNQTLTPLLERRLARWHREGVILAIILALPLLIFCVLWTDSWYSFGETLLGMFLFRLTFYNIAFNKWANLPLGYLGTTPKSDAWFIKIFGLNGALWQALVFFILFIVLLFFIPRI